jgi:hypothetical protein
LERRFEMREDRTVYVGTTLSLISNSGMCATRS